METNFELSKNILQQLSGLSYEEAMLVLSSVHSALTRNLVKAEIHKSHVDALKATCPPGLFELLQKNFPEFTSDSIELNDVKQEETPSTFVDKLAMKEKLAIRTCR